MLSSRDTMAPARDTRLIKRTTVNISGVSAESGGKLFAGYADNSINNTYHGGTHYHQHHERPETPPSPLSTVPFTQNPEFISRDNLLDQIHEKASAPGSMVALFGLGGVGKSQLAIEYSYRVRSQSPSTWVFWIHASNAARFEESFRDIADRIRLPGRHDPNGNILRLVQNWLLDGRTSKWVLIVDNVDDDGFLRKLSATDREGQRNGRANASPRPLLEFLPQSSNGSILFTTRSKELALKLVDYRNLIEIEPMKRFEALRLLQKKLELREESEASVKLVEQLEFMPLAIVQAASYIKHRAPRCSVSQYLKKLQKGDSEAIKLLNDKAGDHCREWGEKNSIMVTWQISFDYIRRTRRSAADLLSLMSFFDRQGIPECLLGKTRELDTDDGFEDDLTTLRDFSFISVNNDGTLFTMHRLVQLTARLWLQSHGKTERWKRRFIHNLWHEFPIAKFENWERCRFLFPHVKSAILHQPESPDSLAQWATLLYRGALYASQSGNIAEVREMASKSREERERVFGANSEDALASTAILATAFDLEGQWNEAENLFLQVIEHQRVKLDEDDPELLKSIENLAETYWKQGRQEEAEKLTVKVLSLRKRRLGENHPDTLTSITNLAATYWIKGRWKEAEKLQVQVINTRKIKLGEDHPHTLEGMASLAWTYWNMNRWEEAEMLQVRVMRTRKIKLGEDHPHTLESMASLAWTYWHMDRWEEAELLFEPVMKARKTKLGDNHPDTLETMANLASTYSSQGQFEEAKKLQQQVMESRRTKLGDAHPDTLTAMASLASTLSELGRYEEADQLFTQIVQKREICLGENHPDTLTSMAGLGSEYGKQHGGKRLRKFWSGWWRRAT